MSKLYDRALRLLALRSHSRDELRRKLLQGRAAAPEGVEEILNQLERQGYLNDEAFAYERALQQRRRSWGLRRIRQDLRNRGIEEEIIFPTLQRVGTEIEETETLQQVIRGWVERSGAPKTVPQLKKLYNRCLRLGYSPGPIRHYLAPYFEKIDWGYTQEPKNRRKR